jgi:hypothetical protein
LRDTEIEIMRRISEAEVDKVKRRHKKVPRENLNPLNTELNPIRHLLALAGAHHFVHVSRIGVKHVLLSKCYFVQSTDD